MMSHVALPTLDTPVESALIGRWFRLRIAGLLLATASIASVLYENQARPLTWHAPAGNVVCAAAYGPLPYWLSALADLRDPSVVDAELVVIDFARGTRR